MKFGTVEVDGKARPVAWIDETRLLDLRWAVGALRIQMIDDIDLRRLTLSDFIALGPAAAEAVMKLVKEPSALAADGIIAAARASVLAPIPRPAKNVFCVGRNYAEHIAEDNQSRDLSTEIPKYPQYFTKPPTSVVGPGATVRLDEQVTRRLDYEVELGAVIGTAGRDIPAERALDHVFGYTIVNDVTARDLQRRHDQWFKGKALDTHCPIGPWIVHKSALPDPQQLAISLAVNGETRQKATTAEMIFSVAVLIDWLSRGLTLEPGDIIATGTPSGAGYAMDPRQFLKDGDVMTCDIEGIGTLENVVRAV